MQAARSSDYAISQFEYLKPLLFYHGREAYRRNSILAVYMFYKNILFVMPQFWYGFTSAFSGQTLYEPILYQFYNVAFTAFPIIIFAILDQEHPKESFLSDPRHYICGLTNEYFSSTIVARVVAKGMFNGLLMVLFVFQGLNGEQIGHTGYNGDLWVSGTLIYAIVVVNANLFVMQRTSTHTWQSSTFLLLSVASFYICFYVESFYPWSGPLYRLWTHSMM
jgi:phospholipid-transporting ATPase